MKNDTQIQVRVIDFRSVVLTNAIVSVRSEELPHSTMVFDDQTGCYMLEHAASSGSFEISVTAPGFNTQKRILEWKHQLIDELFILNIRQKNFDCAGTVSASHLYKLKNGKQKAMPPVSTSYQTTYPANRCVNISGLSVSPPQTTALKSLIEMTCEFVLPILARKSSEIFEFDSTADSQKSRLTADTDSIYVKPLFS